MVIRYRMKNRGALQKTAALLLCFSFVFGFSSCYGKTDAEYRKDADAILYNNKSYKPIPTDRWFYTISDRTPIRCAVSSGDPRTLYFLNEDPEELLLADQNHGFYDELYLCEDFSLSELDMRRPDRLRIRFEYHDYREIEIAEPGAIQTVQGLLDAQSDLIAYLNRQYFAEGGITVGGFTVFACWNSFPLQYKLKRAAVS